MKNQITYIFIALFIILLGSQNANAQTTPMTKGKTLVMAGLGIGGYGGDISGSSSPAILASFMKGIKNDLGPGNLSIGGTMAVKSGSYDGFDTDNSWSYFALVARASYHPHFVKSENFDVYAGLGLGFYSASAQVEYDNIGYGASTSSIATTVHIGARYEFNQTWSAWAEMGNELSVLSIGAAYTIR